VEPALQELLDKQALTELVATYCRGVDRIDRELLATIYHPDALIEHGPYSGGPGGFIDYVFAESAAARADDTVHTVLTPLFEIKGDVAYGETRFLALLATNDADRGQVSLVRAAGRYVDRYERRDGRWGIVHRRTVRDIENLVGDLAVGTGNPSLLYGRRGRDDVSYDRAW
jgi:hypothetical protein